MKVIVFKGIKCKNFLSFWLKNTAKYNCFHPCSSHSFSHTHTLIKILKEQSFIPHTLALYLTFGSDSDNIQWTKQKNFILCHDVNPGLCVSVCERMYQNYSWQRRNTISKFHNTFAATSMFFSSVFNIRDKLMKEKIKAKIRLTGWC